MGLRSRLHFTPRIYCLTLPGTKRQAQMKERLRNCKMPWEFVYGDNRPPAETIRWDDVKKSEWSQGCDKDIQTDYLLGVEGCRRGVRRVLQKGIDDGEQGFILANDDIVPVPEAHLIVANLLRTLPDDVGMLGLCYGIAADHMVDAGGPFYEVKSKYRMEWMVFIRRWAAKYYLEAIDQEGCESDACIDRRIQREKPNFRVFCSKVLAAKLAETWRDSIIGYGRPAALNDN